MQVVETDPVKSGFKYVRGRLELFYFFREEKARDYALQAIKFFLHNARRYDTPHPIFKRVIRNLYGEGMKEHIEYFYINPEDHINSEYSRIDFEYLRILEGSFVDSVDKLGKSILRLVTRIERPMTINPFTRFFRQFDEYIGVLFTEVQFFAPNGTLSPHHRGIAGLREIEKYLLSIFKDIEKELDSYSNLIELVLFLMEENHFTLHDEILLQLLELELNPRIFKKIVNLITNTEKLLPLYQKMIGWKRKEIKFRLEDEQIESLYRSPPSEAHPEYPAIDIEGVKNKLREIFPERRNYNIFIDRLARIMNKVRENKYSKKTKAPEGYIAALVHTVPGDDGRNAIILPGQEPLVIKPVACDRQKKEDYPVGSVFVVWISKKTIDTKSYVYQSKGKNLFYIKIHH